MLDDLKFIHEKDANDALGIAEKEYKQLEHQFSIAAYEGFAPENIVYAAMGGSALAALISTTWPGYTVPFELVRNYDIPQYVSEKTLFIASSYSGNTEETLSALAQAEAKGAKIVVIAGGGKLQALAEEKGYPLALLPHAEQPRYAVLYNLRALLVILDDYNVVASDDHQAVLDAAAAYLKNETANWRPDVPTTDNQAKRIAQELIGRSVVLYGGPEMFPAAYRWKIDINENAKQIAWCDQLPEFNHNEFIGWSKQPVDKPYAVIDLRSAFENERVQKRFEVTARLLSGMRPAPIVVQAKGEHLLEQLLWTIVLGDFVSIYLALLNGLNPAPVDLVEKFKKEMSQ